MERNDRENSSNQQRTSVKVRFTKMKKVQIVVRKTNIWKVLRSLTVRRVKD